MAANPAPGPAPSPPPTAVDARLHHTLGADAHFKRPRRKSMPTRAPSPLVLANATPGVVFQIPFAWDAAEAAAASAAAPAPTTLEVPLHAHARARTEGSSPSLGALSAAGGSPGTMRSPRLRTASARVRVQGPAAEWSLRAPHRVRSASHLGLVESASAPRAVLRSSDLVDAPALSPFSGLTALPPMQLPAVVATSPSGNGIPVPRSRKTSGTRGSPLVPLGGLMTARSPSPLHLHPAVAAAAASRTGSTSPRPHALPSHLMLPGVTSSADFDEDADDLTDPAAARRYDANPSPPPLPVPVPMYGYDVRGPRISAAAPSRLENIYDGSDSVPPSRAPSPLLGPAGENEDDNTDTEVVENDDVDDDAMDLDVVTVAPEPASVPPTRTLPSPAPVPLPVVPDPPRVTLPPFSSFYFPDMDAAPIPRRPPPPPLPLPAAFMPFSASPAPSQLQQQPLPAYAPPAPASPSFPPPPPLHVMETSLTPLMRNLRRPGSPASPTMRATAPPLQTVSPTVGALPVAPKPARRRTTSLQASATVPGEPAAVRMKTCGSCKTTKSAQSTWRTGWAENVILCNQCGLRFNRNGRIHCAHCHYIPTKSEALATDAKCKECKHVLPPTTAAAAAAVPAAASS
ncbi:hypothetical protein AMAG_00408 [Allomyces macrogynus ATCC 38327]|uniref:GATA-type domain-containing protein n=1 Tax=Allomyces macrogynus (strain ATCC 38327) TaxID=578462 RepID=A0A0L0RVU4_ALLM3|nr:hypothetical protein AMAG_00408 [Allomyces macrogynus ATCC 38327]|eukprot:KNE54433.1 hypothetical protein AMAG_00408 [Allomyces macrogynus ATCC 38327]